MTNERLAELIPHIESALEDGYPLQLKGDDLRFLLEAIKARLSAEPGAQPCAQQGGKLALNHDPTYSQPPSKSSVLRPSEPLLSAFKCSSCGKIADNSGDTVGWALCPCGSFRQPERTNV